ncbi:DUF342 domain-containing protein [Deferribacter abyssi]|uniref:DUF342 domain-containing protein n=1 Tax=Deferribacter abyssi TaxID=213806 RepID=UPI003C2266A1
MGYIIKAKSLEEAFHKAQKYFNRNIADLEYKIISINPEDNDEKYVLDFSVKEEVIGKSGKLYDEIFTDEFEVIISEDEMKAYLFIPQNPKRNIDKKYLLNLLNEHGVKNGILEAELERIVYYLKNEKPLESSILVAQGKPPKNGSDGELIIKTKSEDIFESILGADEVHDKVDYKEAFKKKLLIVNENEEVAMIISPSKGENGYTVTGKTIEAVDGEEIEVTISENLERIDNKIISKIKGLLSIQQFDKLHFILDVTKTFIVNGDVDYSTGNIEFPGSVIIKGEIKPDFTVKADGDVIAKSVSGNIITKGNIKVSEGITGKSFVNRLIINAKGEITANYIQFAQITTESMIKVKKYIRDSIIFTENFVEVTGTPGMIYGGKISALKGIKAKVLGSPSFAKTVVTAGISSKIVSEISHLTVEKNSINEQITKIRLYLGNAENPLVRDKLKDKIEKLKKIKKELTKKLLQIDIKLRELYEQVKKHKDAKIEVLKEVNPNVKIIIGEATLIVEKRLRNGYFFYNRDKKAIDYMLK